VATTKPVLKWVGGKTQILDTVLSLFPKELNDYYEPFVGGGSVLLGLLSYRKAGLIKVHGTVYASDLNSTLIGLYKALQSQPDELLAAVLALVAPFAALTGTEIHRKPTTAEEAATSQESYYYWIRSQFNAMTPAQKLTPTGAAHFLFLNKTCFRGVYREGPRGFNVPFGHYKNPTVVDEAHLRAVSDLLHGVVFRCCGFGDALGPIGPGPKDTPDFAYLDPPYAPETATSFVGYNADGFDEAQHRTLFAAAAGMREKNVGMLMSNADVPLVRTAFPTPTFTTTVVSCRRAIHSKEPSARTNEVLVSNGVIRAAPPPQ
jgi:DNA adenine methylase